MTQDIKHEVAPPVLTDEQWIAKRVNRTLGAVTVQFMSNVNPRQYLRLANMLENQNQNHEERENKNEQPHQEIQLR